MLSSRNISIALFFLLILQSSFTIRASSKTHFNEPQWISLSGNRSYSFKDYEVQKEPKVQIKPQNYGYEITLNLAGFWKQGAVKNGTKYDILNLPGWESQSEVGKPGVPMKPLFVELPAGSHYSVEVVGQDDIEIDMARVWPTQPMVAQDDPPPPFTIDHATYRANLFFPSCPVIKTHEVWMRNHRILEIQVAPISCNPVTGLVKATGQLTIKVNLGGVISGSNSALASSQYDNAMIKGLPGMVNTQTAEPEPPKYMILMDEQFESNNGLADFIEWKRRKGNDVVLVKTSDINSNGSPTASEIISYLRSLSDEDYPVYLLIIGMDSQSSGVAPYIYSSSTPSDLEFACRTDDDFLPDLFYARLPAASSSDLSNMLEKVLDMDRIPPDSDMYQKVLMAGQIQDNEGTKDVCDRMHCETSDAISCYFEQDAGGIDYSCVRAITNPHDATVNCLWRNDDRSILWMNVSGEERKIGPRVYDHFVTNTTARSRINDAINEGLAIVQHRDHGYTGGWGNPSYSSSNVRDDLDNGRNRPIVFSNNCSSGSYHKSNNFVHAWLLHSNGGAYAVLGCTNTSSWGPLDYICHGKFMAFLGDWRTWHNTNTTPDWTSDMPEPDFGGEGKANRLGALLNFGKLYMYQRYGTSSSCERHAYMFHLFGDPEAFIQLLTPKTLTISHQDTIPVLPSNVTVTCGVDDAVVCLYGPDVDIHQVLTTTNGKAEFSIDPSGEGTMNITVTGYGIRPFETEVPVSDIPIGIADDKQELKSVAGLISMKRVANGFKIYVPFDKNYKIAIYDLKGKERVSFQGGKGKTMHSIPSNALSSGVYIISIKSGLNKVVLSTIVL